MGVVPGRLARLAARPAGPGTARQRQELERGYAEAIASLPYEAAATPVFDRPRD
ncbi:hypothetical protein [Streptomyces hainanensis]|uniref:hypothetical protein n=1 Tax=Streptomyces hainanensis TaxID=402648 RepID=UPI003C7C3FEC